MNDISMATAEKTKLEQRQREEAAERKEKGQKWETKLFRFAMSPSTRRAYSTLTIFLPSLSGLSARTGSS